VFGTVASRLLKCVPRKGEGYVKSTRYLGNNDSDKVNISSLLVAPVGVGLAYLCLLLIDRTVNFGRNIAKSPWFT
jgi:hypothetical protein